MAELSICSERTDNGQGKFTDTISLRPIAYADKGLLKRIDTTWIASKSLDFAHEIDKAPLSCSVTKEGSRRIFPTRDPNVYVDIGAPQVKAGLDFGPIAVATTATRAANDLKWSGTNLDMNVIHAGHYCKVEVPLKAGWLPADSQMSFPLALRGLELKGDDLLLEGKPLAHFRAPIVYDRDNPLDVRPIKYEYVELKSGLNLLLTLPDLRGMSAPVIDPTLEIQPGPGNGKDTWVSSKDTTINYGSGYDLYFAINSFTFIPNVLMLFDASSIVIGNICTAATLILPTLSGGSPNAATWHSILAANSDWTAAGATWNTRDGVNAWAGGMTGCATSGIDCSASAIGTWFSDTVVTMNPVVITTWFGVSNNNYGVISKGIANYYNLSCRSSDWVVQASCPKLSVTYTLPSSSENMYNAGFNPGFNGGYN
jgi:hypothetical protein